MWYWALAAVTLLNAGNRAAPPAGEFAVRYRNLIFSGPVSTLTVLPGETVTLEAIHQSGRWTWTAPTAPGLYPIHLSAGGDSLTIQAFVLVPFKRVRQGMINGYRIGRYARGNPAGFIEVTRANQNVLVSPHFRLKQFVCKQSGGYPKYIVLDERLLQKLESLLELANASGYEASTFHVMSGYRTPAYNHALGNVPFSRHTWGAAADVFIDQDADGRMDDLNRDGRSDVADADVLYRLFESHGKVAGMGKYAPTHAHGPFVHVDVRERRARW